MARVRHIKPSLAVAAESVFGIHCLSSGKSAWVSKLESRALIFIPSSPIFVDRELPFLLGLCSSRGRTSRINGCLDHGIERSFSVAPDLQSHAFFFECPCVVLRSFF